MSWINRLKMFLWEQKSRKALSERERLKREHSTSYETVVDILARHDPVGIVLGDLNPDEYDLEAVTILPKLKHAKSVDDVRRIVHKEFVKWFGPNVAGQEEKYAEIAHEIWSAMKRHVI